MAVINIHMAEIHCWSEIDAVCRSDALLVIVISVMLTMIMDVSKHLPVNSFACTQSHFPVIVASSDGFLQYSSVLHAP